MERPHHVKNIKISGQISACFEFEMKMKANDDLKSFCRDRERENWKILMHATNNDELQITAGKLIK